MLLHPILMDSGSDPLHTWLLSLLLEWGCATTHFFFFHFLSRDHHMWLPTHRHILFLRCQEKHRETGLCTTSPHKIGPIWILTLSHASSYHNCMKTPPILLCIHGARNRIISTPSLLYMNVFTHLNVNPQCNATVVIGWQVRHNEIERALSSLRDNTIITEVDSCVQTRLPQKPG